MKNFLLFRFVPERLLRRRFFQRAEPSLASSPTPEPKPERGRIRYIPIQIGAQIMPYIIDTGEPTNRR